MIPGVFAAGAAGDPGMIPLPIPDDFGWVPPVNVYRSADGAYSTDFNADDWKVSAEEDIWVSPTGDNATGDGSYVAPYRSIQRAMQHATAGDDVPYNVFVVAGEYPFGSGFMNTAAQRDLNIIAVGGRAKISNRRAFSGTWTDQGGGAYTCTLSSISQVYDDANPTTMPDGAQIGQELLLVADSATCISTAGSYFVDGTTVWVHLFDGRVPDAGPGERVHLFNLTTQVSAIIPGRTWFMQGLDFESAASHVLDFRSSGATPVARVVVDDCTARYWSSNSGKAFNLRGVDLGILHNCRAYHGHGDAFSASVVSAGGPTTQAIEIGCRAYDLGIAATADNIINGSTNHEGCTFVRVNGDYGDTYGPVCADVGPGTQNWYLGTTAARSLAGSGDQQDSLFQAGNPSGDTVKTWLDGCVFGGGAHFDLYAGAGCQILYRNMAAPTSVGGAGTVGQFL